MAKKRNQYTNASVEERAAQLKRQLTFLILILMVMSLTVCDLPSREELMEEDTITETAETETK